MKVRLDAHNIPVAVLVNNAGYGLYETFLDQPIEKTLDMLRVNMLALTELTYVFAAEMIKGRSGHILLVASLLGYQAVPGYAAYAASKGYVLLFGEALHAELKSHGVSVTVLSPGATSTSFGEVAGQRNTIALRMSMMRPQLVASAGIQAMLGEKSNVVAGVRNRLVVLADRVMPRTMQRTIMRKVMSG